MIKMYMKLDQIGAGREIEASVSMEERVGWVWAIFFSFVVPELFMWFRSTRICLFRTWRKPTGLEFLILTTFETLHVIGLALLVYLVLPNLKVVEAVMLTNCVCLIPGILKIFSRFNEKHSDRTRHLLLTADGLAVVAQLSGLFLWAAIGWTATNNAVWILPFSLLLTSFGWWENYVDSDSPFGINEQPYHFPSKCLSITIHFICSSCHQIFGRHQREHEIHQIFQLHVPDRLEGPPFLRFHVVH